jgi:hypothetical protein
LARLGVRGTFSQPGPSHPTASGRLARTLGVTTVLELGSLAFFALMARRISRTLRQEAITLEVYEMSQSLAILVYLFPIGPIVLFYGHFLAPFPLSFALAACCYLPALVVARRQSRALQAAGTDRVHKAGTAVAEAFGIALVGKIVVIAALAITWGARTVSPSI